MQGQLKAIPDYLHLGYHPLLTVYSLPTVYSLRYYPYYSLPTILYYPLPTVGITLYILPFGARVLYPLILGLLLLSTYYPLPTVGYYMYIILSTRTLYPLFHSPREPFTHCWIRTTLRRYKTWTVDYGLNYMDWFAAWRTFKLRGPLHSQGRENSLGNHCYHKLCKHN